MKFTIILSLLFTLIELFLAKTKLRGHHPDPSYNPIRSNWVSGPRIDLPRSHSRKYINNNKALISHHSYRDNTRVLQRKALHKKK